MATASFIKRLKYATGGKEMQPEFVLYAMVILDSEIGTWQVYPSTASFVSAVQNWLDHPGLNHGLILRRLYGNTAQYIKYTTNEGDSSHHPRLTINGVALPWPPIGTMIIIQ